MKLTLNSSKYLQVDKYYRPMIDLFISCNFDYTNFPLNLIENISDTNIGTSYIYRGERDSFLLQGQF